MGARSFFEKEDILFAALDQVKKGGLNCLTARTLAKQIVP